MIALSVLLSSCLNITYNHYGDNSSPSPLGGEVITYETNDEETPKEETEKSNAPTQEIPSESKNLSDTAVKEEITPDETNEEVGQETPECFIKIASLTSPISVNQTATLVALGKPFTSYAISVYYKTSQSTAQGLEPKLSDENGRVSWSWKIGASVKTGRYRIVVSGGGETIETEIQVS